tara:strand:- start:337 stop:603 length:267 start_codon:yes stop_codon:yes gene_type:complete
MNSYNVIRNNIIELCKKFDIPIPEIQPALDTDPCDYTDYDMIRINVNAAEENISEDYHSRHVFGHYLADLHEIKSDLVADAIASMLKN